ncbi:MAG: copper-binding protein [Acidobacteria bacterium]|nr:copper-binding protein [Acidobacteriota bacterium]MBV9474434.1 copper-binding protein [Acidobacteriota bacterium]
MKRLMLACVLALFAAGCGGSDDKAKPVSEPGEKLYEMHGTIVSRNPADNSLHIDHDAIPGFMEAMAMDYTVRGAKVASLPPDRTRVAARLHVTDRSYWITDVKKSQ